MRPDASDVAVPGRAAWLRALVCVFCVAAPPGVHAQQEAAASAPGWMPSGGFVQYGEAETDTRALTVGVTWPWQRRWSLWGGEVGGYWELALGHWSAPAARDGRESAVVTQVALTPTFRWRPRGGASPWFAEAAIGLTVTMPVYESRDKRFSTAFNFADHVAIGRNFGPQGRHEVALRLEHFSNGGISHPNPGENFLQLRYSMRWR